MKILLFIKTVFDTKVQLEYIETTGNIKQDWNVPILNPDDEAAVASVVRIKSDFPATHVTIVHLGPPEGERFIRDAVSLGCDDGIRLWDEGFDELHTAAKALLFARVATILGFDLIFTGTKGLDTGTAQLGILLASHLQIPSITRVVNLDAIEGDAVKVTRLLDYGYREQVRSLKPLVVAFEALEVPICRPSFAALVHASDYPIPCLDLSQTGIPRQALQKIEARLAFGPPRFPVPRMQFVQPPDSSLPAFDRRRQLAETSAAKRERKVIVGEEDSVAESLFQTLLEQGWLDHLRDKSTKD